MFATQQNFEPTSHNPVKSSVLMHIVVVCRSSTVMFTIISQTTGINYEF